MFLASPSATGEIGGAGHADLAVGAPDESLPLLAQGVAKAYCQASLGVLPEAPGGQFAALERFEDGLARLRGQCAISGRSRQLAALEAAWVSFRTAASSPPSRPGCALLAVRAGEITRMSVAFAPGAGSRGEDAWLAGAADRQAELAQKLAVLYLARASGVKSASLRDEMVRASEEFSGRLTALQLAGENTPEVTRRLGAIALQWEWFRSALNQEHESAAFPSVVAEASDAIVKGMKAVRSEYRALP
jgi:hypothetical protein